MSRRRRRKGRRKEDFAVRAEIAGTPDVERASDPRPTPIELISLMTYQAVGAILCLTIGALLLGVALLLAILGSRGAGTFVMGLLGLLLLLAGSFLRRGGALWWALKRRGVEVVQRESE